MTENVPSNVAKLKERLGKLLSEVTSHQWEIGDLLVTLIDEHGEKLADLAREFGYAVPTLSQYYSNAKAFPQAARFSAIPYWHYDFARNAENRAVSEADKRNIQIEPNYPEAVEIVTARAMELAQENPQRKGGISKREATEAVSFARRDAYTAKPKELPIPSGCHHMTNEAYLDGLAATGIKAAMIHLDPPYASYRRTNDGKLDTSTSRSSKVDGDNLMEKDAIATTCDTIKRAEKVLAPNGVILLWQASNVSLRLEILQAIIESGLIVDTVVTWDKAAEAIEGDNKGMFQPGAFTDAWAIGSELLYVLHRDGERASFQELGYRHRNVIRTMPVQHRAGQWDEKHFWIKPLEIMELLVRLHTQPGDLVLDLFGCTGQLSIAAQKLGRKWMYVESFKENFDLGSRRIAEAVAGKDTSTDTVNINNEQGNIGSEYTMKVAA